MRVRPRVLWGGFGAAVVAILVAAHFMMGPVTRTPEPDVSPAGVVPPPCGTSNPSRPSRVLVLTNFWPGPSATVNVGDVFELSFPDYQGFSVAVPRQKPALTCSLGQAPGGPPSTLLLLALQPGTVQFFTSTCPQGHCDAVPFWGRVTIQ